MAAKNTAAQKVILVEATQDKAEADVLVDARTVIDKETGQITWYVLCFVDNNGEPFEILMPGWWKRQYVTKSIFPDGLYREMKLNEFFLRGLLIFSNGFQETVHRLQGKSW